MELPEMTSPETALTGSHRTGSDERGSLGCTTGNWCFRLFVGIFTGRDGRVNACLNRNVGFHALFVCFDRK